MNTPIVSDKTRELVKDILPVVNDTFGMLLSGEKDSINWEYETTQFVEHLRERGYYLSNIETDNLS